nr:hypothetical protein [Streptococcus oralis]
MSRPRKIRILLAAVLALVVGITLYSQYQSHQERFQLKTSFEEKDTIAVLKHLTASGNMRLTCGKQAILFLPMELFAWMEELTP